MADEVQTQTEQVVETPPAPPAAPPEPVDEEGVPYKNRIAELRRKMEEQEKTNVTLQQRVGELLSGRQAAPPATPSYPQTSPGNTIFEYAGQRYEYDPATVEFIRKMTDERANVLVGRAALSQEASDQEIRSEAENIYRNEVSGNPFYASWPEDARQAIAIKEAKSRVANRKYEAAKKGTITQVQNQAAQAQAAAASLPTTGIAPPAPPSGKDQYIKEYVKEWTTEPDKRKFVRGFYKLDPDSPEALEKIKRAAEQAYAGIEFGGKTGAAIDYITQGGR